MRQLFLLTISLVSASLTASTALAQHHGGGHGGYHGGGYHGGYHGSYGGYSGVRVYTPGISIGIGYGSYPYGYYGGYSYGPRYYTPGYYYTTGTVVVPSAPSTIVVPGAPATTVMSSPLDNAVTMEILLPNSDARLWISGVEMTTGGSERRFQSPALDAGKKYVYTVKTTWQENGRTLERIRNVDVRAGANLTLDLRGPDLAPPPTPVP